MMVLFIEPFLEKGKRMNLGKYDTPATRRRLSAIFALISSIAAVWTLSATMWQTVLRSPFDEKASTLSEYYLFHGVDNLGFCVSIMLGISVMLVTYGLLIAVKGLFYSIPRKLLKIWRARKDAKAKADANACRDADCECGYHMREKFDTLANTWIVTCTQRNCLCVRHPDADEVFDENVGRWVHLDDHTGPATFLITH